MDTALDRICYFLADHPWLTCAVIFGVNLIAAILGVTLP